MIQQLSFFLLCLLVSSLSAAAPTPGTSSSELVSQSKGSFLSDAGFKVNSAQTKWLLATPPADSKYMVSMYRSPKAYEGVYASLSVRLDRLDKDKTLKQYMQKWLKRYPRFGFKVLGAQKFKQNGHRGYVVDLAHQTGQRQLRQAVYLKNRVAVVMTCRDHLDNFKSTLKDCNKIIRSFRWDEEKG